jgi:hypothetical protein
MVARRIVVCEAGSDDGASTDRGNTATTEEDHPMFAPNASTHQLADSIHRERLNHSAMIQKVMQDRDPHGLAVDRQAQRRITSRRLAATIAAAALTFTIAAAVGANQPTAAPAEGNSAGGGVTLIR